MYHWLYSSRFTSSPTDPPPPLYIMSHRLFSPLHLPPTLFKVQAHVAAAWSCLRQCAWQPIRPELKTPVRESTIISKTLELLQMLDSLSWVWFSMSDWEIGGLLCVRPRVRAAQQAAPSENHQHLLRISINDIKSSQCIFQLDEHSTFSITEFNHIQISQTG